MSRNIVKSAIKQLFQITNPYSPYPLLYSFMMTYPERTLFDTTIRNARCYLEFGMGGSTIRTLQKSSAQIYSVETSREWIEKMRAFCIIRKNERQRLTIFPVDIGPTGHWGYPEECVSHQTFDSYGSTVFDCFDNNLLDVALIDGRFRVASTLQLLLKCHQNKGLKILIHDFWIRPQYHVLLEYLDVADRSDSLGLFTVKKNVNLTVAEKTLQEYRCITK